MKLRYSFLVVLAGLGGCNGGQTSDTGPDAISSEQSSPEDSATDTADDPSGDLQEPAIDPPGNVPVTVTHVIASEEAYYLDGPQQMRPPDGKFKTGTRVELVQDAGSYSVVVSEDGIRAYVSTGALKPVE